jgi:predicted secreted protein
MRTTVILILAAAVSVPVAAARSADEIVKIGPKANGTTVLIRPGYELDVALPGNATTGYSWRLRSVDRSVLKQLGTRYVPKKTAPGKVGSGGTYILRFRAISVGFSKLKLVYVRAGRNAKAAKRFAVDVNVKGFPHV